MLFPVLFVKNYTVNRQENLIKHHVLTSKFPMTSAVLEHLVKIGQTRLDDK